MNNTHKQVKDMIKSFYPFAKKRYGFDQAAKIVLNQDIENSSKPLGKTAYYDPQNQSVTVYTHERHPKDIMRSIAHELVHHTQNCRGDLSNIAGEQGQGYAQENDHLREMEREAYEQGNLCFRDWEDGIKSNLEPGTIYEKRNTNMATIKDHLKSRDASLFERLMENYGYKAPVDEAAHDGGQGEWYSDEHETLADKKYADSGAGEEGSDAACKYAGDDSEDCEKHAKAGAKVDEGFLDRLSKFNKKQETGVEDKRNKLKDIDKKNKEIHGTNEGEPEVYYQPQFDQKLADSGKLASYEVFASKEVAQKAFPYHDIVEYSPQNPSGIGSPTFVDDQFPSIQYQEANEGGNEGGEDITIWVDLEMDNEKDHQNGGEGNWEKIVIPQHILQQAENEEHAFELVWEYVSEETGWLVAGTDEESEKEIRQAVGGSLSYQEANEGGEGVHDIFNMPEPEAAEKTGDPKEDAIRAVVSGGQAAKIEGMTLDLFSAGAIVQILDALSPENKAKYMNLPIDKMAQVAMKMMKEEKLKEKAGDDSKLAKHRSEKSLGDTRYTGKQKGTLNKADRKHGKAQTKKEKEEYQSEKVKEALKRVFKKNPALIKVAKKVGVKRLAEEISKRDFQAQAWERAGATSRTVSDEEAGSVESFNNWLEADPSRQQNWEPAQSYRGGRVLAYNRKDQKYYDVQADMYIEDDEMDAILPEAAGGGFEPGDKVQDDRNNKTYVVVEPMAGGAVVKDEDGNLEKIRDKFLSKIEGDQTVMREKALTEGENVGHHAIIDGEFYVDSNFLNKLNTAEMGQMGYLEHIGFGDFSFNSQDGKEMRFSRGGKDIPGQVGRSHEVYSHPPEFIEDVVAAMEAAGHSTNASAGEALPPQGEPTMQQESITRRLHKLLEGKKLKKTQVNKLAKMVAAKLLEKKYKRDEDEDEKDKKEDLDESGASCGGGGEAIKLKVDRDGDEPGDFPGDGQEPVNEEEWSSVSVEDFAQEHGLQVDRDEEGQKILYVDAEQAAHLRTSGAERVVADEGWSVERDNSGGYIIYTEEHSDGLEEKTKKDLSDRRPTDTPADRLKAQEGKLPPALQAAIDKKKGKDGDDDKDKDKDEDESKTEGKLPPALQAAIDKKKGKDGDEDKDEDKDKDEDLKESGDMGPVPSGGRADTVTLVHKTSGKEIVVSKAGVKEKLASGEWEVQKSLEERGYRGESEPGSMFDPYGDDDAAQYGGQEEDDELSQYKDLLAALEGGDEGVEPPPPDVQAQLDAEFGEEEEEEHDPRFDGDSLQEFWDIRNARRTEKFMSWAIPKKKK